MMKCPYCNSTNVKTINSTTLCKEGTPTYPNRQIEITEELWKCNACNKRFKTQFTF